MLNIRFKLLISTEMVFNYRLFAKITIVFLFLTSFSTYSHAQDYYGSTYGYRPVSLGITFAPNVSWHRYGNGVDVNKNWEIGYGYGLLADFGLAENYYFSTGFLINSLKSSVDVGPDQLSTTYRTQYVEVPIGLKLKSTQRYYRSYYGQFGFTGGIEINGDKQVENFDREDFEPKTFRLGLAIGGGVEWQLDHNLRMVTGLTFNNGFTQILDDGYGKPKDSYLSLNFAIFF